uniref:Ion_trans_2 domain-containing protein n=1 Tax=Ascaris lumbricoides TaxID=6252 RepID=A0A0M3HKK4_ASCLU
MHFSTNRIFDALLGYGFVTPTTKIGRLLIIIYGLIGAPLVLVTLTDVGKFISFYSTKFLPNVSISFDYCFRS